MNVIQVRFRSLVFAFSETISAINKNSETISAKNKILSEDTKTYSGQKLNIIYIISFFEMDRCFIYYENMPAFIKTRAPSCKCHDCEPGDLIFYFLFQIAFVLKIF